jgi:hypothetical protein
MFNSNYFRKHRDQYSMLPYFCLNLFILLFFNQSFYGQSKTVSVFEINDPRNPECPCHQLQKIAENEYSKLHYNSSKGNYIVRISKKYQKSLNRIYFRSRRVLIIKRKEKPDYSVCFKW